MDRQHRKARLRTIWQAALSAADPARCVPAHMPSPPRGRTLVVGAGKASAAMARAFEQAWSGGPLSGLVITRYGHAVPCQHIEIVEASHPVPDQAGVAATQRLLDLVVPLTADDLLVALISGGGSALLVAPVAGLSLADKQALTRDLLRCGATISEINCVRRALSRVKGGGLLRAAAPAPVVTLAISDVPGDDPAVIASGPTVPLPASAPDQAVRVLTRYGFAVPPVLAEAARQWQPQASDPQSTYTLIATPQMMLEAAARQAEALGYRPYILGDAVEGEARQVGAEHARVAAQIARGDGPVRAPAALLSGGETTVTVTGDGRGGRNSEFLLEFALTMAGQPGISALAADTDGIDGSEDNAGAYCLPDTLARMSAAGIDPASALANNDAYGAFAAADDLLLTGPTLTNVNDFRLVLIEG